MPTHLADLSDKKLQKWQEAELLGQKRVNYFGIGQITAYPKNRIEITKNELKIYENKNEYSIPRSNYEDFYFQDLNTVIYNIKKISYSNPNRIFAKKEGLWGIIDKNENVISNFQYEDVIGLNAKEIVELKENNKKYDIEYKNIKLPKNNIFLVKKGNKSAVIDENGKILIPYKEIKFDMPSYKTILHQEP